MGEAAAAKAQGQLARSRTPTRCKLSLIGGSWRLRACRAQPLQRPRLGRCERDSKRPRRGRFKDPTAEPSRRTQLMEIRKSESAGLCKARRRSDTFAAKSDSLGSGAPHG